MSEAEKRFTQKDVDRIVEERLKRDRMKAEKDRKEVEQEKRSNSPDYKAIYFKTLKEVKLLQAGFAPEQTARYSRYLDAETPEGVEEQARELAEMAVGRQPRKQSQSSMNGISFK